MIHRLLALLLIASPCLADELTIREPGPVSITLQAPEPGVYDLTFAWKRPLPPPPTGTFLDGQLPSDGFKGSTTGAGYRFRPAFQDGQRFSGIVTIVPVRGNPPGVPYRLLVDGVPQPSSTIDTSRWADGTHALAFQVTDPVATGVHNGSRVCVFNNSGQPLTSTLGQAIVASVWNPANGAPNSLAWGRVDALPRQSYPLDISGLSPVTDDAARQRLANQRLWTVHGFNHAAPTPLWKPRPELMKNRDGDWFIKPWNPQGGGSGVTPLNAQPWIERAPAYDGPRGVGTLSPYASLSPHPRIQASGYSGWVGVEKSGRVVWVDVDGTITTILGPRSVGVGTDSDEMSVTLDDRLASGEKEFVGDANGKRLDLPHDIWPCNLFPQEGIIADTGNNRVVEIQFYDTPTKPGSRLMRSWPLPGVTSVWASKEIQESPQINIIWVAANPQGLWCQRHTRGAPGTRADIAGGLDGSFTGHDAALIRLADIPLAFWVRGSGTHIYIFTTDLGVYEYSALTGTVTERLARRSLAETYVFAAIDEAGSIGPRGRIYWGSASQKNGGYGSSKVNLFWLDPSDWSRGTVSNDRLLNRVVFGSWTAGTDPQGHYLWGVAIHPTLPMFLTCGISSSGWFAWTGHLGTLPTIDPPIPFAGTLEFRQGKLDSYLGLATIFGWHGSGGIGYDVEQFRGMSLDEVRAKLEPLLPRAMGSEEKAAVIRQVWRQRN